jgi:hypothetical protein
LRRRERTFVSVALRTTSRRPRRKAPLLPDSDTSIGGRQRRFCFNRPLRQALCSQHARRQVRFAFGRATRSVARDAAAISNDAATSKLRQAGFEPAWDAGEGMQSYPNWWGTPTPDHKAIQMPSVTLLADGIAGLGETAELRIALTTRDAVDLVASVCDKRNFGKAAGGCARGTPRPENPPENPQRMHHRWPRMQGGPQDREGRRIAWRRDSTSILLRGCEAKSENGL